MTTMWPIARSEESQTVPSCKLARGAGLLAPMANSLGAERSAAEIGDVVPTRQQGC